jgi:hypothetical protein
VFQVTHEITPRAEIESPKVQDSATVDPLRSLRPPVAESLAILQRSVGGGSGTSESVQDVRARSRERLAHIKAHIASCGLKLNVVICLIFSHR